MFFGVLENRNLRCLAELEVTSRSLMSTFTILNLALYYQQQSNTSIILFPALFGVRSGAGKGLNPIRTA